MFSVCVRVRGGRRARERENEQVTGRLFVVMKVFAVYLYPMGLATQHLVLLVLVSISFAGLCLGEGRH